MRCYQEVGLNEKAKMFLEENEVKILSVEDEDLFYENDSSLRTIQLKDGQTAKEVIQACPWPDPVCFLCLEINGKKMFEWSEEKILKHL